MVSDDEAEAIIVLTWKGQVNMVATQHRTRALNRLAVRNSGRVVTSRGQSPPDQT